MSDVHAFIQQYDGSDNSRIAFAWNGEHADEFADANYEFRKAVLERVCDSPSTTPIVLIRDLYRAETQLSKEAWGVDRRVGDLANELLNRGGVEYVEDYLEGKFQSFDASMSAACVQVDLPLVESLLGAVRERMQATEDEERLKFLKAGEETFTRWIEGLNR